MKKIIILLSVLSFITFNSCDEEVESLNFKDPIVMKFINDKSSKLILKNLEKYGSLNEKSFEVLKRNFEGTKMNFINFKVYDSEENVAGYLQILEVNNKYYNQYIDATKFHELNKTGELISYDLNTGDELISYEIKNDALVSYNIKKKELQSSTGEVLNQIMACAYLDINCNGDVTFSECFQRVSTAIDDDGFSTFVCGVPIFGWTGCWSSTTAACAYWSATH